MRAIAIIRSIPAGRVTTYGMIAAAAGNRRGARQVARILHSCSEKYGLPWHRVVNRNGEISVRSSVGYLFQRSLLAEEGVLIGADNRIDFAKFLWQPEEK
ncbi:MAG: DNA methyltransferase [Desulfobacterales bacterium GWB2_56_26]|nr:MAG: DNA methyltransferase [Desulfobacterales bacterium GWB2_56_26]